MAETKVYVVARDGEFFVFPPAIVLTDDDVLKIMNMTKEDLAFVVPTNDPFGTDVCDVVKKKGSNQPHGGRQVAKGQKQKPDVYTYQITMLQSGKKAKGNSDPMIIIDG